MRQRLWGHEPRPRFSNLFNSVATEPLPSPFSPCRCREVPTDSVWGLRPSFTRHRGHMRPFFSWASTWPRRSRIWYLANLQRAPHVLIFDRTLHINLCFWYWTVWTCPLFTMASHAAMLLDPKGYKKRLQRNGIFPQSPSLTLTYFCPTSIRMVHMSFLSEKCIIHLNT